MAYERQTWEDFVTLIDAEKMTHIEDGIVQNERDITELSNSLTELETSIGTQFESSGKDLNDYIENGIYFFTSANSPANIPAGSNGWLVVLSGASGSVKQFWFRLGVANSSDY